MNRLEVIKMEEELNIPISTTEDYEEIYGDIKVCPECGSYKLHLTVESMEDHHLHETLICDGCGYTETN